MVSATSERQASDLYTSRLFSSVLAMVAAVTVITAAYVYAGGAICLTLASASMLALGGWLATTGARPNGSGSSFSFLVATVVALVAFYAEQWLTGFPSMLSQFFPASYPPGTGLSSHSFIAVFALGGMALMILGMLAYYHRLPVGDFAAWFTFTWAISATVLAYAVGLLGPAGPQYAGGMVTGPLMSMLAVAGIVKLRRSGGKGGNPE